MRNTKLILWLILILAVLLRLPNLNIPPVGLHNAKEVDYLSPAKYFLEHGIDFQRHSHVLNEDGRTALEDYPQAPLLSGLIALIWKITGEQLWSARLLIIFLSLLCLPFLYRIAFMLLRSERAALLTCLFYAVLPVSVFYGRNIQPEMPALSLAIVAIWLTTRLFHETAKPTDYFLCGILWSIVFILKATIIIVFVPWVVLVALPQKKYFYELILALISFFALPLTYILSIEVSQWERWHHGTFGRVSFFAVFTPEYWGGASEGIVYFFTSGFSGAILLASVVGLFGIFSKAEKRLKLFSALSLISIVPYFSILSDYITQHDYYYVPFILPVCVTISWLVLWFENFLKDPKYTRIPVIRILPGLFIFALVMGTSGLTQMHFDRIFYGLDTLVDFFAQNTKPEEKIWVEGGIQSYGFCYASNRYCVPLAKSKAKLEELSFEWLVIHNSKVVFETPDQLDFIRAHYVPVGVAGIDNEKAGNIAVMVYLYRHRGAQIKNLSVQTNRDYEYTYEGKKVKVRFASLK